MQIIPPMKTADLTDEQAVKEWVAAANSLRHTTAHQHSQTHYAIDYGKIENEEKYTPIVTLSRHGTNNVIELTEDLFNSNDYLNIIQRGDKKIAVASFEDALTWLMKEGKRGLTIQRYKGLGEMNPDQLWETTMDPESRRLLQVKIEDAIQADQIFTALMGDHVEPRRQFIEENALSAENIDI